MIGGAADLVESTKTEFEGGGVFSATHAGRNIAVRHPRARAWARSSTASRSTAACVKPYRLDVPHLLRLHAPAVRLSALMGLPVVWVWTHDSIGLGEDGPTHQPVEHSARCARSRTSGTSVPADANETSFAWKVALERARRPGRAGADAPERARRSTAARLRRPRACERGAYVLWEARRRRARCHPARHRLRGLRSRSRPRGRSPGRHRARVVSMPCWELFEEQPEEYRDEVLPPDVRGAARDRGGHHLRLGALGRRRAGTSLGIDRFGASAPGRRPSSRSSASPRERSRPAPQALLERPAGLKTRRKNNGQDRGCTALSARPERLDRLPLPRAARAAASSPG